MKNGVFGVLCDFSKLRMEQWSVMLHFAIAERKNYKIIKQYD